MDSITAFLILAALYFTGEFIGTKTKAWVPSVFVIASFFLFGYWTFFPKNIVELAGLGAPLGGVLVIMLCITHMGTIISINQLVQQWKIIVITLAGLAGMVIFCWFIGGAFVERAFIIAGLPPLTGGIVAATMMNQAALAKGLTQAAVIAIALYAVQGFVGYPLTAVALKREGRKLLHDYRSGVVKASQNSEVDASTETLKVDEGEKRRLIPPMPEKYVTSAFILAKLMAVAFLCNRLSAFTGGKVNQAVLALIFGIIFTELGFLDKNSLQKAGAQGFLFYVLMVAVFGGLKDATPEMMISCIKPMAIIVVTGVVGMVICAAVAGKVLKVSNNMAIATSLTALYGFPPNYILTEESVKALAETPEEHQYLMEQMLPQMIVGGFITVTITSVVIAGIFVNLL